MSDAVAVTADQVESVSQGITVSDAVTAVAGQGRFSSQGLTITAAVSTAASFDRSVSQGITMSDAVAVAAAQDRSVSQGITMSDAVATDTGEGRIISQGIAMSDAVTADVTVAPPGAGGPSPKSSVETDMFGDTGKIIVGKDGETVKAIEATSEDGMLTVTIPMGTVLLDEDGDPPSTLTVEVDETPPPSPEECAVIGLAYDFGPAGGLTIKRENVIIITAETERHDIS